MSKFSADWGYSPIPPSRENLAKPEFRLWWINLCSRVNQCTTTSLIKVPPFFVWKFFVFTMNPKTSKSLTTLHIRKYMFVLFLLNWRGHKKLVLGEIFLASSHPDYWNVKSVRGTLASNGIWSSFFE